MCLLRGTNLPPPWSRLLLEKLTSFQLVKKFHAFYGTRRFITAFTSAGHVFLSRARSIQSIPPHPTSWRSILILSSHLRLARQELNIQIQTGKFWVLRVNYRRNREKHIEVRTEILWMYSIFGHATNVKFASVYIFRWPTPLWVTVCLDYLGFSLFNENVSTADVRCGSRPIFIKCQLTNMETKDHWDTDVNVSLHVVTHQGGVMKPVRYTAKWGISSDTIWTKGRMWWGHILWEESLGNMGRM
jgi:hypothetical protein